MEAGTGKTRGRSGRLGSAPRPREAILPPGPSKAPAALHVPTFPPLGSHSSPISAPRGAALRRRPDRAEGDRAGKGGCGEGAGPDRACRGARARGGAGGGAGADAVAGRSVGGRPTAGRGGREKGEGGEPLPILGRSRRRRRPAVGESKVVAGRHFGIFPQPAGHCGGHGESGPMAGGQP